MTHLPDNKGATEATSKSRYLPENTERERNGYSSELNKELTHNVPFEFQINIEFRCGQQHRTDTKREIRRELGKGGDNLDSQEELGRRQVSNVEDLKSSN